MISSDLVQLVEKDTDQVLGVHIIGANTKRVSMRAHTDDADIRS